MNNIYRNQVELLIRIMPSVYRIKDFAVHGGTAINLFHRNMPRYSVDIDITYIPLQGRDESLQNINRHLSDLKVMIEKTIPGIKVIHKPQVWKLLCTLGAATVKIEVNGTKRGLLGSTEDKMLCEKAQKEFNMACKARLVSWSQLLGGKVAAALARQHPRDLFDCRDMTAEDFNNLKKGFMLCLLGSDKPIVESLNPNPIDQNDALTNQFEGMSDEPFPYGMYEQSRSNLINVVNQGLDSQDRDFLISFESGLPDWDKCMAGDLSIYPSVQWKLKNLQNLKNTNSDKLYAGVDKLRKWFAE